MVQPVKIRTTDKQSQTMFIFARMISWPPYTICSEPIVTTGCLDMMKNRWREDEGRKNEETGPLSWWACAELIKRELGGDYGVAVARGARVGCGVPDGGAPR